MHRISRRIVPAVAVIALGLGTVVLLAPSASADTPAGPLSVTSMDNGATAAGLAQSLAGTGVTLSNVTYTGAPNAAGTFSGGDGIVGFGSGIALSTGSVQTDAAHSDPCAKGIEGPNQCDSNTTQNGTPGDPDLDAMAGFQTFDASVLQFDFVPAGSSVTFKYVFGSDEYPEYANSVYNDTFAFFVNGQNCALAPGSNLPVSINTINGGNPLGTNARDPEYYVDNHYDASAGSPVDTEFDGMTTVLTCTAAVTPGQTNHMKLAIADGSDQQLDSTVLLQADSLVSPVDPTAISTVLSGAGQSGASLSVPAGTPVTDQATLSGRTAASAGGTVTYTVYSDAACSTSPVSAGTAAVVNGVVSASTPVTLAAGNYYWQAGYSGDSTHATTTSTCGDEILTVTAAVNSPPTGSTGGPYTGAEGAPIYITASAADGDGDAVTHTWSVAPQSGTDPGAACVIAAPTSLATTVKCNDDGVFALALTISDGVNPPVVLTTTLTVSNVAPAVVIKTPANASTVDVGSLVNLSATFVDPGSNDTQTCTINWGDGTTTNGFVSAGTCIGSHTFTAAGTRNVTVRVLDDDGGVGTASITLVAGSSVSKVTGGGFVGGCSGKTTFGFVVMSSATGALSGQFEMNGRGNADFHGSTVTSLSTSTKWTTTTATWTGGGTWNGASGYTFTASVTDGGSGHGAKDTISFTVRSSSGHVVYSVSDELQGGKIVIH
jgi:hypothetical protein